MFGILVFADIPVEGWTINPYIISFFYCSGEAQVLPFHYDKSCQQL